MRSLTRRLAVFGCGIYIGPIFDKYGSRWLVLSGTIMHIASIMLLSICTRELIS